MCSVVQIQEYHLSVVVSGSLGKWYPLPLHVVLVTQWYWRVQPRTQLLHQTSLCSSEQLVVGPRVWNSHVPSWLSPCAYQRSRLFSPSWLCKTMFHPLVPSWARSYPPAHCEHIMHWVGCHTEHLSSLHLVKYRKPELRIFLNQVQKVVCMQVTPVSPWLWWQTSKLWGRFASLTREERNCRSAQCFVNISANFSPNHCHLAMLHHSSGSSADEGQPSCTRKGSI